MQRRGHSKKGFTLKPLRSKSPNNPRKMFFLNKKRRRRRKEKTKQNQTQQNKNLTKQNQTKKRGMKTFWKKKKILAIIGVH